MTPKTVVTLERGASEQGRVVFEHGCEGQQVTIGSSTLCDWRIAARGLRARHACLLWNGRALSLEVEGRRAGAFVDGWAVAYRCELMPRAKIQLGHAVLNVSRVVDAADAPSRGPLTTVDAADASSQSAAGSAPDAPMAREPRVASHDAETVQAPSFDVTTAFANEARAATHSGVAPGSSDDGSGGGNTTLVVPLEDESEVESSAADTASHGPIGEAEVESKPRGRSYPLRRLLETRVLVVAGLTLVAGGALAFVTHAALGPGEVESPIGSPRSDLADGPSVTVGKDIGALWREATPDRLDALGEMAGADSGVGDAGAADPSRAARYLLEGRHAEALGEYRQLAEFEPGGGVYGDLVSILEREIGRRCAVAGGGRACGAL